MLVLDLLPKGKADYAFLLHDLFHIKPDGIMTIVLPHGVLFRGGEEGEIRKNLIENNHIDAIIGAACKYSSSGQEFPPSLWCCAKSVRIPMSLSSMHPRALSKRGKNNKLRASDIKRIADTFIKRENIPKFSRVVIVKKFAAMIIT